MEEDTLPYFWTTHFYQLQKKTKLFFPQKKPMALFFSYFPTDTPTLSEDSQGQQKIQYCVNPNMCNAYW